MAKIDELLKFTKYQEASDLHIASGSAPYLRVHGQMERLKYKEVSSDICRALIYEILSSEQRERFEEIHDLDTSYTVEGVGRFRVNVFLQRNGIGAVFRRIPEYILPIKELGLPEQLHNLIDVSEGLILVTGPTGSGKSTTLASLIHSINSSQRAHVITIEDPIEFVHRNDQSLINQREVNSHTQSFSNALRAALREDPDIILVGEMRDLETISLAITAAETGHLVFATLHTNNAVKAIDRIIDVFPPSQQAQIRVMLSESLRGVIAQSLVKRTDGTGRAPIVEILVNVPAVANLIREGKTFQIPSVMQTARGQGMVTYEAAVNNLVKAGAVTLEESQALLARKTNWRSLGSSVNQPVA
jgi:twitching motility protein PilT